MERADWFLDGLIVSGFANHPMSSYNEGMELVGTIQEPARRGRPGVCWLLLTAGLWRRDKYGQVLLPLKLCETVGGQPVFGLVTKGQLSISDIRATVS